MIIDPEKKRRVVYETALISHIDILGFQELIDERSPGNISRILRIFGQRLDPEPRWGVHRGQKRKEYFLTFSDLCVTARPLTRPKANVKAAITIKLMQLIEAQIDLLLEGVVVRGAVTVGKAALSWGLLYGQGIVDAYLQERDAGAPRIIVDQSVIHEEMTNSRLWTDRAAAWQLLGELLAREVVGDKEVLFLDYLWIARLIMRQDLYQEFVTKHRNLIDENLAKHAGSKVAKKYEWMDQYHTRTVALISKELLRFPDVSLASEYSPQ